MKLLGGQCDRSKRLAVLGDAATQEDVQSSAVRITECRTTRGVLTKRRSPVAPVAACCVHFCMTVHTPTAWDSGVKLHPSCTAVSGVHDPLAPFLALQF